MAGSRVNGAELPNWDLTPYFPSIHSPEFDAAFSAVLAGVDNLVATHDSFGIGDPASEPADPVAALETILSAYAEFEERARLIGSYLYAVFTEDLREEAAQTRMSELQGKMALLGALSARMNAWIGRIDLERALAASTIAREHEYMLRNAAMLSRHLMSQAEEDLAAELSVTGGTSWARLYESATAMIQVSLELDGETREIPMSELRLLAHDPDRDVRRRAYEAEIAAWASHAVPIAACLNGIKGEDIVLARRRHWPDVLESRLFGNAIDRPILDAMLTAARERFPAFRDYLRAKAKLLGVERMAWFDLFAPVPFESASWSYDASKALIESSFAGFSPRMGELARRAFAENWIDAPPRPGKTDGAYCTDMRGDESRILMNFVPSYSAMSTLAHELGHAYHNVALSTRSPLLRDSPSTLAETASIFCETLVREAAMAKAGERDELVILEGTLQEATQVVLDIASRFQFESEIYARRADHDVQLSDICALMTQAQQDTYGDGLDETLLHPYMWAVKGHYYGPGAAFYNFPYMFGMLFGLGLFAVRDANPTGFVERYDDLLSSTGMANARELGARFGIELDSVEFWRASLDVIEADIRRYEELVAKLT